MVRQYLIFVWVIGGTTVGTAHAGYQHCYPSSPRPDLPQLSVEDRSNVMFGGYVWMPILYRRACNLTNVNDVAYVTQVVEMYGCTATSEIGERMLSQLTSDLSVLSEFERWETMSARYPEVAEEACAIISSVEFSIDDRGFEREWSRVEPSWREAMEALSQLRMRFHEERPDEVQ